MRSSRDPSSPWGRRLWFDAAEFDPLMDDLRLQTGGDCFAAGRGIDVDRVLLRALRTEADYIDLPPGMLGRTHFWPDGAVRVEVSRALADGAETDSVARRRLRTTLAHECGHIACHRVLYLRDTETLSLFPTTDSERAIEHPPMLCRHNVIGQVAYRGEWWEYQANQCIASLLLPRHLFACSVRSRLAQHDIETFATAIRRGSGDRLLRELSDEYDVNPAVALFRLQELGFVPDRWQPPLLPE